MAEQRHAGVLQAIFAGGGEMGALMRSLDWAANPLGPAEQWPQSLKTAIRIVLTSRQPMWVWWGDQLINLYNDAYRAILGGKHPDALGQPAAQVWREIWDQVGPRAEFAMQNNEGTYDEALLLIMERNGYPEETYYTFSYSPVPNDQGGTGGIICANTDDTQRIIGERQLALLRELAANTADARTFDDACRRSIACLETNLYDLPFAMIYLVDDRKEQVFLAGTSGIDRGHTLAPESVAIADTAIWPFAAVINTQKLCLVPDLSAIATDLPTGAWMRPPKQAVAVPIAASGQQGKAGILVVGLNPFRLFDEGYRGFIDLVAAQIAASIANAQAYAAERHRAETLAELDRAKTIFFSNISHEFRTPLTLMLGPLEDILADPTALSSDHRDQLEAAHRNSLRLLKLVNTLLDFSRIEAGRVQAAYQPTDLASLTIDLAGVFRSAIERAGMRLEVNCPPLPEPVYVDRSMWEKIVLNLLSNAFKFTLQGEIAVQLQWADNHVELTVKDTGTGIPATEIPHLFERFHRVQGSKGRTYEGSGIGLSLVQELVKLHGGTIHVSSIVDRGSCFTVNIPTGYAHIPANALHPNREGDRAAANTSLPSSNTFVAEALRWLPETPAIAPHDDPPDTLPTAAFLTVSTPIARLLLADDNADMRDYVKRLLVNQHYAVTTVSDGLAALATIRQQKPDLVLSDIMMPGLDGLGLLRELRADAVTQDIPIILLSARAGEEARIEGLEAGADDYLIKPFSARELMARVEATLKLARLRQTSMRQEQALRIEAQLAEANLERVLASINDQFLVLDRNWRYTYVNDRVVEVVGMSREALLGQCIWDIFPHTVNSHFYTEVQRAVAEQTVLQFEYYYAPWQRWFENRIYPSVNGVSVLVAEVTDKKLAEAALRQSEGWLQLALGAAQMFVWELDLKTQWAVCSDVAQDMCGFREGTKDAFIALTHPDDIAPLQQTVEQAIATGTPFSTDYRIISPDGTVRWLSTWGSPQQGATGSIDRMIGVSVDVTERKQAETALSQSEERYRYLAESIPQLVWTANAAGVMLDVNQRWTDFTGVSLVQVQLEGWQIVVHPDDLPILAERWTLAQQQGAHYQAEGRMRRADGVYRWYLHQAVPLKNEQGAVIKWFGTATDIDDQKRLEQERERLLAQEQLARETAEQANRVKDEFLAVLSHELRSPLNPILGWSRLLQTRTFDQAKTAQALATIERNAKLQAELIEDLLDVSRILRGKLSLNVSTIDLVATIQAALETVRLSAEAKGIQIQTQLDHNARQILGDASRLQQIVWNLLSNAVKFTPTGGKVCIRLEQIKAQAQITVQDTGRGIAPDFLPYVFDYFRQADATTTRKFGGLGLGLAIVHHLVELHGGTVRASSPGNDQGATFTVQLPLAATPAPVAPTDQPYEPASDLQGVTILVVDDDADARELVVFLLEQYGAKVIAVASAQAALAALTACRPDLLLSDIGMPEMDGYTLMQQIRSRAPADGGQIPAIALTAYAGDLDYQRAIAAGFQQHLAKPIEPTELVAVVAGLTGRMG